jgi:hypothetical protein
LDLKIKMSPTNNDLDLWNTLIEALRGTCDSIPSVLNQHSCEHLEDHLPFLYYLDQHIFLCEICGWWCELSEMADNADWQCRDCCQDEEEY